MLMLLMVFLAKQAKISFDKTTDSIQIVHCQNLDRQVDY